MLLGGCGRRPAPGAAAADDANFIKPRRRRRSGLNQGDAFTMLHSDLNSFTPNCPSICLFEVVISLKFTSHPALSGECIELQREFSEFPSDQEFNRQVLIFILLICRIRTCIYENVVATSPEAFMRGFHRSIFADTSATNSFRSQS